MDKASHLESFDVLVANLSSFIRWYKIMGILNAFGSILAEHIKAAEWCVALAA